MNTLQALFSAHPALTAIPLLLLFAFTGLGFMTGTLQVLSVRTKRSSYDKAARQLCSLALILGWVLLICSRVWLFFASEGYVPKSFLATVVELSWGMFGFAVIAVSVHFAVWRHLGGHRILHSLLAFFAGINGSVAVYAILGALRLVTAMDLPNASELTVLDLFNFSVFPSPLISACALTLPLILGVPPAAALIWLMLRRGKDDYGRDYYNTFLSWCARWGLRAWVVVTLLTAVDVWFEAQAFLATGAPFGPEEGVTMGAHMLTPVALCLIFGGISRSELPLRQKPWMIASVFLCLPPVYFLYMNATAYFF